MHTTPLVVIVLTLLFVVLINLALIFIARRSSGSARILSRSIRSLGKPFQGDDRQLNELSELVNRIKQEEEKEQE